MPYLGREISGEYLALGSFVVERANISVGPGGAISTGGDIPKNITYTSIIYMHIYKYMYIFLFIYLISFT